VGIGEGKKEKMKMEEQPENEMPEIIFVISNIIDIILLINPCM
jgi:hypothetical protein